MKIPEIEGMTEAELLDLIKNLSEEDKETILERAERQQNFLIKKFEDDVLIDFSSKGSWFEAITASKLKLKTDYLKHILEITEKSAERIEAFNNSQVEVRKVENEDEWEIVSLDPEIKGRIHLKEKEKIDHQIRVWKEWSIIEKRTIDTYKQMILYLLEFIKVCRKASLKEKDLRVENRVSKENFKKWYFGNKRNKKDIDKLF